MEWRYDKGRNGCCVFGWWYNMKNTGGCWVSHPMPWGLRYSVSSSSSSSSLAQSLLSLPPNALYKFKPNTQLKSLYTTQHFWGAETTYNCFRKPPAQNFHHFAEYHVGCVQFSSVSPPKAWPLHWHRPQTCSSNPLPPVHISLISHDNNTSSWGVVLIIRTNLLQYAILCTP